MMKSNLTELLQVRVTPDMAMDITILAGAFRRMTESEVVRAMIDLTLGNWSPFTAGEAQEVLREANDE